MILTNFLARSSSSVAIKAHGSRLAPAAVRCSYSHWRSLPLWHSNIRQTISHGLWRGRRHKRRGVWTPLDSLSSQLMQWKSDWRDGRLVNWCVCMCVCVWWQNMECHNHIRAVFPVADSADEYCVCGTGAHSPQEMFLDVSLVNQCLAPARSDFCTVTNYVARSRITCRRQGIV